MTKKHNPEVSVRATCGLGYAGSLKKVLTVPLIDFPFGLSSSPNAHIRMPHLHLWANNKKDKYSEFGMTEFPKLVCG